MKNREKKTDYAQKAELRADLIFFAYLLVLLIDWLCFCFIEGFFAFELTVGLAIDKAKLIDKKITIGFFK